MGIEDTDAINTAVCVHLCSLALFFEKVWKQPQPVAMGMPGAQSLTCSRSALHGTRAPSDHSAGAGEVRDGPSGPDSVAALRAWSGSVTGLQTPAGRGSYGPIWSKLKHQNK